jgi:NosR/NirI family nitrous oxide reductase transcriptional regulator
MRNNRTVTPALVIKLLAILFLAAAYLVGFTGRNREILPLLTEQVPETAHFTQISEYPLLLKSDSEPEPNIPGYYIVSRTQGWGGPLTLAVAIDLFGLIQGVHVLEHNETLSFFYRLEKKEFFKQFISKHISDPLSPDKDVDTVTQATVSSEAFTKAVRLGSHWIGSEVFSLDIPRETSQWNFGWQEGLLILLFAAAGLSLKTSRRWIRGLIMTAAFLILGFKLNASLSIAHYGALLLGYVPQVIQNPFWWILVAGALLAVVLLKRNLYCHVLCPFGNLQELNAKISGINLPLAKGTARAARALPYVLTWLALMIIFLKSNPVGGAYEPFSTLFGFEGIEIQWIILPAVIVGSFFITRFFCRFFCPAGTLLNLVLRARCQWFKTKKGTTGCPE